MILQAFRQHLAAGAPDHFRHRIAQLRPRRPRELARFPAKPEEAFESYAVTRRSVRSRRSPGR